MSIPVFVHAADLHLGAPLKRLGEGLSDEIRVGLRLRASKALENLIDLTITRNAEFLLLAGDLYDGAEREAASQIRFRNQMERLGEKGIRVYIVHGNHDPTEANLVEVVKLPENVKVFEPGQVEVVAHELRNGSTVLIAGISYWRPDVTENLVPRISAKLTEFRASSGCPTSVRATIGLLHTNVGSTEHANYAPCSANDLAVSPFDYWALGHIHKRSINQIDQNRYWAYPGNLQARFFKENEPKGALVVPILAHGVGEPTLEPCDEIRFVDVRVDCSKLNPKNLDSEIAEACRAELQDAGDRSLIVRIVLHGQSNEVLASLDNLLPGSVLLKSLNSKLEKQLSGGCVDDIENRVEPVIDFDALKQDESIVADILRAIDSSDLLTTLNESLREIESEQRLNLDDLTLVRSEIKADLIRKLLNLS